MVQASEDESVAARPLRFLLAHPGGPFFRRRDEHVWTIPKGLVEAGEDPFVTARREFEEETGFCPPAGDFEPLGSVKQSRKLVHAWAFLARWDPVDLRSNAFEMEWPPKSGTQTRFPEVDRAQWMTLNEARPKIIVAQFALLERATERFA